MLKRLKNTFDRVLLACALTMAFSAGIKAQTNESLPTLRGNEAIQQLKQNGQYDSLKEAVNAARQDDEQKDAPTTEAIEQTAKLTATNAAGNDYLGNSISMSGDTIIVGASTSYSVVNPYTGKAFIFVRSGTTWTQQARLADANGERYDTFGASVAISGNTAIVGAPFNRGGGPQYTGTAYIYVRSGTTWTLQQKLNLANLNQSSQFGSGVALSGDTAFVGATGDSDYSFAGSVSVYVRSGTNWTLQTKFKASDGFYTDRFGCSLAFSGETLIVGANGDGNTANKGAAYIFVRSGTTWSQQAKLVAPDGIADDHFGNAVSISGNTVIVGSSFHDVNGNIDQGAAYVFVRSGTAWSLQQKLIAPDGAAREVFGSSVGISGETLVVGAANSRVGTNANQGAVYVFYRVGTTWNYYRKLTGSGGATNDNFGTSVAISDETIVSGATGVDIPNSGFQNQGAAYVLRNPLGSLVGSWEQEARIAASDGATSDGFGYSVALSGDTAIIGAPGYDGNPNTNQGAAYVFVRQGAAWIQQQKLIAADGASLDGFGFNVAISGNTAVIGAIGVNYGPFSDFGAAYVFVRVDGVWTQQQKLTSSDAAENESFGYSVGISGDTIAVGSVNKRVGDNIKQGAAYVFVRSGTNWTEQQKLTASDGAGNDQFGTSIAISADTVIVGAPYNHIGGNNNQGAAYVFIRSDGSWFEQQLLTASDGTANAMFGISVAVSSNGAVVGAYGQTVGSNNSQGAAYVFDRSGTVWTEQRILTDSNGAAGDQFGYSVGISGNRVIVGANWDNIGTNLRQGSAHVFIRANGNWTQERLLALDGALGDNFGQSVAISDSKIMVGAPYSDISAAIPQVGKTKGGETASLVPDQGGVYFFANSLRPTAARVSISGRVQTPNGAGLQNAIVQIMLSNGEMRTARTATFGAYRFDGIDVGQTIIVSVTSKQYQFNPQIVSLTDNLTDMDFIANR